jgi:WD40 repeat protein
VQCKGVINEVRVIDQAHDFPISCLCYSSRLSLLATSSADGYCHLWDFATARNATMSIRTEREITAVFFLDPYKVLITGKVKHDCWITALP